MLTTLLVGNVAINSALSIFLGSIASGFTAGLIATALIVLFGEITPQAIFSRYALTLGAKMAWLVQVFLFILYPIAWPIAWILDKTLGEELATIYSKRELVKIIEEHRSAAESDVDASEEKIVKGALTFSDKHVKDIMTPRTVVVSLEASQKIDEKLLDTLRGSSHTRIPVYKDTQDNVVGILYLKNLLGTKHLGKTIEAVANATVFFIDENKKLDYAFDSFLAKHHHMFIVTNEFGGVVGVITLEDILEEIIKSEIVDEADKHKDLRAFARSKK